MESKSLEEVKKHLSEVSESPFPWRLESDDGGWRSLVDANNTYIELEDLYDYMQALEREVERLSAVMSDIQALADAFGTLNKFDLERIKEKYSEKAREADTNG